MSPSSDAHESGISIFFKHPAVLLLLGFVSTGLIGTWLTETWKAQEWHNQQNYLLQQSALEKKYVLIDETVKAVAETDTAAEDVLASYTWNWNSKEVKQRRAKWLEESLKWRIDSKVISQKLSTYFTDSRVRDGFDEIMNKRKVVGNTVTNLLTGGYKSSSDANAEKAKAEKLLGEIAVDLKTCGKAMADELSVR